MKKISLIFIFFLSCSIFEEEEKKIDLSMYFPLEIGNKWIYELKEETFEKEIVNTMIDSNNNIIYQMLVKRWDFYLKYYEYYFWNSQGLWRYFASNDTSKIVTSFPEKLLIIKSPVYPGDEWKSTYENLDINFKFEGLSDHDLYSHYGRDSVLDTTLNDVALISQSGADNYYAKGIGLIQTNVDHIVLIDYDIK